MIEPIYRTAQVTLYNGDSLELCPQLPTQSVDVTITDYPYNISQKSNGLKGKELHFGEWDSFSPGQVRRATLEIIRLTRHSAYIFCGDSQVSLILRVFRSKGWHVRQLTWCKPKSFSMNVDKMYKWATENVVFARQSGAPFYAYDKPNYFFCDAPAGSARDNPTQKPEQLISDWLSDSAIEGNTIFDPFMGSGTTIKVAQQMNMRAIGIDARDSQCLAAIRRIAQRNLF